MPTYRLKNSKAMQAPFKATKDDLSSRAGAGYGYESWAVADAGGVQVVRGLPSYQAEMLAEQLNSRPAEKWPAIISNYKSKSFDKDYVDRTDDGRWIVVDENGKQVPGTRVYNSYKEAEHVAFGLAPDWKAKGWTVSKAGIDSYLVIVNRAGKYWNGSDWQASPFKIEDGDLAVELSQAKQDDMTARQEMRYKTLSKGWRPSSVTFDVAADGVYAVNGDTGERIGPFADLEEAEVMAKEKGIDKAGPFQVVKDGQTLAEYGTTQDDYARAVAHAERVGGEVMDRGRVLRAKSIDVGSRVKVKGEVCTVVEKSLLGTSCSVLFDSGDVEEVSTKGLKVSDDPWDVGYTDGRTGKQKSVEKGKSLGQPGDSCPECGYHLNRPGDIGSNGDAECPNCGWEGNEKAKSYSDGYDRGFQERVQEQTKQRLLGVS